MYKFIEIRVSPRLGVWPYVRTGKKRSRNTATRLEKKYNKGLFGLGKNYM